MTVSDTGVYATGAKVTSMTSLSEVEAGAPTSGHGRTRVDPPAGPLTARRARTRQRLMAAAVAVFAERGVIGSSVEEICEAAGFTRGAFYSNFADKDALVLALIEQGDRRGVRGRRGGGHRAQGPGRAAGDRPTRSPRSSTG